MVLHWGPCLLHTVPEIGSSVETWYELDDSINDERWRDFESSVDNAPIRGAVNIYYNNCFHNFIGELCIADAFAIEANVLSVAVFLISHATIHRVLFEQAWIYEFVYNFICPLTTV